jgi:hypothetical protein
MTAPAQIGVPWVVLQAARDMSLPPMAQRIMWCLSDRLDLTEYREVKLESLANMARCKKTTAGELLTLLVGAGYIDEKPLARRSRAFRLMWSRRITERAQAA